MKYGDSTIKNSSKLAQSVLELLFENLTKPLKSVHIPPRKNTQINRTEPAPTNHNLCTNIVKTSQKPLNKPFTSFDIPSSLHTPYINFRQLLEPQFKADRLKLVSTIGLLEMTYQPPQVQITNSK